MYQRNLDQIDNHNLHYHHNYFRKIRTNRNDVWDILFTYPPHVQSRGKFFGLPARLQVHDFNKPCLQARLTAYVTPAESIAWVKAVSRFAINDTNQTFYQVKNERFTMMKNRSKNTSITDYGTIPMAILKLILTFFNTFTCTYT